MRSDVDTNELLDAIISGELPREKVNSYLSRLIMELSQSKIELQKRVEEVTRERDAALEERVRLIDEKHRMTGELDGYIRQSDELSSKVKEYEERLVEMSSLRENSDMDEGERSELIKRISEAEDRNCQIMEEYEDLARIRQQLLAELENAKIANDELLEQQQKAEQELEKLTAEADALRTHCSEQDSSGEDSGAGNEQGDEEPEVNPYYNTELMTSSGFDLLAMLNAMKNGTQDDGSSVQVSKSWEEESEEISADPNSENGQIVKKIRKKTEVSVKYTNANSA